MESTPEFKSAELVQLAHQLTEADSELARLGETEKLRRSLLDRLEAATYQWTVLYELQVRYHNGHREGDFWVGSSSVLGSEHYSGRFVEDESTALEQMNIAKNKIRSRINEKVTVKEYYTEHEGVVVDCNIIRADVTKGAYIGHDKSNVVYAERHHENAFPLFGR